MATSTSEVKDLFQWSITMEDMVVVDVKNEKDFNMFCVDRPYFVFHNIPCYAFTESKGTPVPRPQGESRARHLCQGRFSQIKVPAAPETIAGSPRIFRWRDIFSHTNRGL